MTYFGFNFYKFENKPPDFCLKINDQKFNCNRDLLSTVSATVQNFVSKSKSHGCSCKIQDIPRGSDWNIITRLLRNERIEINSGNFRFLHKVAKSLHISSLEQATSSFIAKSREDMSHRSGSNQYTQNNYDQRYESPKAPNKATPPLNLNLNTSINNNNYYEVGLIPASARSIQPYHKHSSPSSKHHHKNSPSPSVSSRHANISPPKTKNVEFQFEDNRPIPQNKDNIKGRTYDFEKGRKTKETFQEKERKDYDRPNKYLNNDQMNFRQNKYYNNDNYNDRNKKPQDKNDYLQHNKLKNTKNTRANDAFEYDVDNDYNDHEVDDDDDIAQKNKKPTTGRYDDILTKRNNYDEDSASLALKNSEFQNYGINRFEQNKRFPTKYNDNNQRDDKYKGNENNNGKDRSINNNYNDNDRYNFKRDNNNDNKRNRYNDRNKYDNDISDNDKKYESYSDYEEQYAWLRNNKHQSHNSINKHRSKGNDRDHGRNDSPSKIRKSNSAIPKGRNDRDFDRYQDQDRDRYGDRYNDKRREVKIDLNQSYDQYNDNGSRHHQNLNVSRDSYRSRDALSKGSNSHHSHHRRSNSPKRHSHHTHHEHREHGDHRSRHSHHDHDRDSRDMDKRSRDREDFDKRSRDRDEREIELDRRSNGRKERPAPTSRNQPQKNSKRRSVSPTATSPSAPMASPGKERSVSIAPTVHFVIDNPDQKNQPSRGKSRNDEEEEVFEIEDNELGLENLDPDYDNIECLKTMETSFLKLSPNNVHSAAIECINLLPSVSYQVICRAICYSYAVRYNQPEVFYTLAMKIFKRLNDNNFLRVLISILDQPPPEFANEFGFFKSCFSDEIQFINSQNNVNYYDINSNSGASKKFKIPNSKNQVMAIIRRDDIDLFKTMFGTTSSFSINKLFGSNENEFRTFANQDVTMLEYAAFYGSYKIFKFLFDQKGIQYSDKLPMFAVAGGNFEIVKLCADQFFDDCPALAVKFHRWDIFEWLIDQQQESYSHQHIFRTCLEFSNFRTLFKFIKRKKGKSEKMLTKAAQFDNLILYKYLLKLNDKEMKRQLITIKRPHGGYLPLHYAVINQNLRFVKFLLDISTDDVNNYTTREKFEIKVDPRLMAPIHFACKGGNLLILRLLLKSGKIDINEGAKGKNLTPLHIASKHGNTSIVKYLLKRKKIRVNEQTLDKKMTALHFACAKGYTDIVYALLNKKGIITNLKNSDDFNLFIL